MNRNMCWKRLMFAASLALAFGGQATQYYVDPVRGSDDYNGKAPKWEGGESTVGPKATINAATTLAKNSGDVVILAPGHYKLTESVVVRGTVTFMGADEDASQTILDGQGTVRIMTLGDAYRGNIYIRNLTFANGYSEVSGGAFYGLSFAVNVFSNCVFTSCTCPANASAGAVHTRGNLTFFDCSFRNCRSLSTSTSVAAAGAVYSQGYMSNEGVRLTNCEFEECSIPKLGGGALYWSGPAILMTNCTLKGNRASTGGAFGGVFGRAFKCTFVDNVATNGSSGVFYANVATSILPRFDDCTFTDNIATNGSGSVTQLDTGNDGLSFRGCVFERNKSYMRTNPTSQNGTQGGVLGCKYNSGSSLGISFGTIEDCVFRDNVTFAEPFGSEQTIGGQGAAIGAPFGAITGCTFENNYAQLSGGAIAPVYKCTVTQKTYAGSIGIPGETVVYEHVISNCAFVGNHVGGSPARTAFGPFAGGAVMLCGRGFTGASYTNDRRAEPWMGAWVIADCQFVSNRVDGVRDDPNFAVRRLGGALHVPAGAEIVRCAFTNNWCEGAGGAVSGAITNGMRDCTFFGNYANCTNYVHNRFFGSGGAVLLQTGPVGYEQEIVRCSFVSNSVLGDCGSAVAFAQGNLKMEDCQFVGNTQTTNACRPVQIYDYDAIPYGGALAIEPACYGFITTYAYDRYSANSTITVAVDRCSFVGNKTQGAGGGLSISDKFIKAADLPGVSGSIRNCFFKDNEATYRREYTMTGGKRCDKAALVGTGGGLAIGKGQAVSVENCTFVDNAAETAGGSLDCANALSGVTNCVFHGGSDASEGETADLRLTDATVADYCFAPLASPLLTEGFHNRKSNKAPFAPEGDCPWTLSRLGGRDQGLRLPWMTDGATDLLGNPRVKGLKPDFGCFERQRAPGLTISVW